MPGPMTYSPADVLRKMLVDLGLGTDISSRGAWPVFAGSEPVLPDDCITVYDTAGIDGGRTSDGERSVHQGIQVRVRANNSTTAYTKVDAVATALDRVCLKTVVMEDGSSRFKVWTFVRTGGIVSMGKESPSTNRSIYTLNGNVSVRQVA